MNGYNTAAYGKSHETPGWEIIPTGPFDRWPTGSGFEEFYGFVGGDMNQWVPSLYHGTTKVELKRDANYHLITDMADKAIAWMGLQKSLTPDKPFFLYFAPALRMLHITPRRSGSTSTRASSTWAGTSCASRPLKGRRRWVSSLSIPRSARPPQGNPRVG